MMSLRVVVWSSYLSKEVTASDLDGKEMLLVIVWICPLFRFDVDMTVGI